MKRGGLILVIVAAVALWGVSAYNGMVKADESVNSQWANVESAYQRRSDLIPNLVETVKGYAEHEKGTFEAVINARAKATQVKIDPTNMTPEQLQQFQAAQGELSSALGKLLAVAEAYPDLKANENFLALQSQLEGTENRINTERNRFNEEAKSYNVTIKRFPKNLIANIFGFDAKAYFEAQEGAENAPKVQF